jgi:hypothetical protein
VFGEASVDLRWFAFDPFSFQQDGLPASAVSISRDQIVDAIVIAQMVVVCHEGVDLVSRSSGKNQRRPPSDTGMQIGYSARAKVNRFTELLMCKTELRSTTQGTPSLLISPSGFGISTRLTGRG